MTAEFIILPVWPCNTLQQGKMTVLTVQDFPFNNKITAKQNRDEASTF